MQTSVRVDRQTGDIQLWPVITYAQLAVGGRWRPYRPTLSLTGTHTHTHTHTQFNPKSKQEQDMRTNLTKKWYPSLFFSSGKLANDDSPRRTSPYLWTRHTRISPRLARARNGALERISSAQSTNCRLRDGFKAPRPAKVKAGCEASAGIAP